MCKPKKPNRKADLNDYIKKSHIKAVEKFKAELEQYKETCDPDGWLYEDANTSFTLDNIHVENGCLKFDYDGEPDSVKVVVKSDYNGKYYEESFDGIMDYVKFWRSCLRRAQRYWSMHPDELDKLQDGEIEEEDEEED